MSKNFQFLTDRGWPNVFFLDLAIFKDRGWYPVRNSRARAHPMCLLALDVGGSRRFRRVRWVRVGRGARCRGLLGRVQIPLAGPSSGGLAAREVKRRPASCVLGRDLGATWRGYFGPQKSERPDQYRHKKNRAVTSARCGASFMLQRCDR